MPDRNANPQPFGVLGDPAVNQVARTGLPCVNLLRLKCQPMLYYLKCHIPFYMYMGHTGVYVSITTIYFLFKVPKFLKFYKLTHNFFMCQRTVQLNCKPIFSNFSLLSNKKFLVYKIFLIFHHQLLLSIFSFNKNLCLDLCICGAYRHVSKVSSKSIHQ